MPREYLSISTKVYIPLVVLFIIIIALTVGIGINSVSQIKEDIYGGVNDRIKLFYKQAIGEKSSVAVSNAVTLSFNDDIRNSLTNNDREKAIKAVKDMSQKFKSDTKFRNIQIHIHTKDLKSFVRSWKPNDFGQDLSSSRHTLKETQANKKAFAAIEVGERGLSMRGVAPILNYSGEVVGSVEFIQAFMSVIKDAKSDINASTLFLLKDSYAHMAKSISNNPKYKNFIIAQDANTVDKELIKDISGLNVEGLKSYGLGEKYFVISEPISDFKGETIGYLIGAKEISSVNAAVESAKMAAYWQIASMLLVGAVMTVVIAIVTNRVVKRPIMKLERLSEDLASGDGDLTKKLNIKSKDELELTANAINKFIEKVRVIVTDAKKSAGENAAVSSELSSTALNIGKRAEIEAQTVSMANKQGVQMRNLLSFSIQEADETKEEIRQAKQILEGAKASILSLIGKISITASAESTLAIKLERLSDEAEQVKSILGVIADIADQTNLLALNAAIEAARAGEHGRGFAVVADEVRKLAERTQKSLSEINITINTILSSIAEATEQMDKNSKEITSLTTISSKVENDVNNSFTTMTNATEKVEKMAEDTVIMAKEAEEIVQKVRDIDEISASNARSVEEIAAAAEHLYKLTEELNEKLGEFKT